jgi:dihydrofolate reductase
MRKVILGAGMSLDGYIARRDGGIDFLRQPKGYSMSALFATLDTVVFGRKTFDEAVKRGGGPGSTRSAASYAQSRMAICYRSTGARISRCVRGAQERSGGRASASDGWSPFVIYYRP